MCKGGFQHKLRFMDIHICALLCVKVLHLHTSGDKINLRNTKKYKTSISWKVVKSENTFLELSSNNLFSINVAPSKDGGTYRRELNERESKMHNLIIECEKEK